MAAIIRLCKNDQTQLGLDIGILHITSKVVDIFFDEPLWS